MRRRASKLGGAERACANAPNPSTTTRWDCVSSFQPTPGDLPFLVPRRRAAAAARARKAARSPWGLCAMKTASPRRDDRRANHSRSFTIRTRKERQPAKGPPIVQGHVEGQHRPLREGDPVSHGGSLIPIPAASSSSRKASTRVPARRPGQGGADRKDRTANEAARDSGDGPGRASTRPFRPPDRRDPSGGSGDGQRYLPEEEARRFLAQRGPRRRPRSAVG